MRPAPAGLAFSHIGFYVRDLERMADFYTRLLGFEVSDRGRLGSASLVFLTRDPREHHQIVLVSGRPEEPGAFNRINQISFRVSDLAGLREIYQAARSEKEVSEIAPVSHGNALSVYFRDPEGNRIEVFLDTPWHVEQPLRIPMDLSLSDEALWQWAERTASEQPGFRPAEAWRAELGARIRNHPPRSRP